MTAPAAGPLESLFEGLFDDAALFPPGNAPMAAAVPAHHRLVASLGALVGPFVVPAGRLDELAAELTTGPVLPVSVIAPAADLPAALERVAAEPELALAAVEVPVVADATTARGAVHALDASVPPAVPAAVEVPRTAERDAVLDVLAGTRYRAKLRTGGLRAELFPTVAELADTLAACVARGVPVKCTAGLHSAVRRTDAVTGFPHHGFLNVLLAASALGRGDPPAVAEDWLTRTDPGVVLSAVRSWTPEQAARARSVFTSFGTCSVLEPVEDLVGLGLLPAGSPVPA